MAFQQAGTSCVRYMQVCSVHVAISLLCVHMHWRQQPSVKTQDWLQL